MTATRHAPKREVRDGRVRRAESQRKSRRHDILVAALRVFSRKGYHEARIADIVEESLIARGTFYLYFQNKNAIFLELLDQLLGQLRASVIGVDLAPGAPPVEAQLLATAERIFQAVHSNRALAKVIFRYAVGLDREADHKLAQFYAELRGYIGQSLRLGQQAGLVRQLDLPMASLCILGSIKQLIEHEVLSAETPPDSARMARAALSHNLFGCGVARPTSEGEDELALTQ